MHSKLRIGGLAAVVSATTLVLPLLAIGAAQAAAPADLSITKTVASAEPPIAFTPSLRDVRSTGHEEWTRQGLHVWTEGWTETDKVAEFVETATPLADVGEPTVEYAANSGTIPPGFELKVDIDGNGSVDGSLTGEPTYYGTRWWLGSNATAAFKIAAPSCDGSAAVSTDSSDDLINAGHCTGGNGSAWHGTLQEWRAEFPDAVVRAWGFALGWGVLGDGVITGLNFANTHYDLTRTYKPAMQAAPGETVEYKITIANSGGPANAITITDVLPGDLTYVPNTLSRPDWCAFSGKTLSCTGGNLPTGTSSDVYFKAKLSSTVTSNGLQPKVGHIVDVQKQEVFANLPANGQPQTFNVMCPAGYVPTDGGLLIDAVDQGGYYSDIVTSVSKPTTISHINGWTVTATNFGDERGQGKVKVTCLAPSVGSSDGHTHAIEVVGSAPGAGTVSATEGPDTVTRTCPTGYTPIAPAFQVTSGVAVVRTSIAVANSWKWTVDHDAGTAMTFGLSCLAPQAQSTNGHTASLGVSTQGDTISLAPESRDEGVQQCLPQSKAVTGGYEGTDESVLSLGKEQRGNNYMFRFYNDDWASAHNAKIQVTCVADRTPDEPRYYHVTNTATVQSPDDPSASSSTADIAIVGDPLVSPSGPAVGPNGSLTGAPPNTKKVNLQITCTAACVFTVKVSKNGTVVAKATKSYSGSPNPRTVAVPTTSAGKNLGAGSVTVKLKTDDATITKTVTLS